MEENSLLIEHESPDGNISVDSIIKNLEYFDSNFPTKYIKAASQFRKEISPKLISSLEYVYNNHDTISDDYMAHMYSLFLLSEFREIEAFPYIPLVLRFSVRLL